MKLIFTTPVVQPLNNPQLTGINVDHVMVDPDTGAVRVIFSTIEDSAARSGKNVSFKILDATLAALQDAIKKAIEDQLGVTFK